MNPRGVQRGTGPGPAHLRVTWLGHATVVLDLDSARLVTDPLIRRHHGLLRRRGPTPRADQWQGADAVLLSHLHHDHADLTALRRVNAPVLTADVSARFLRRHGITGATGLGEEWGRGWYDVPGTQVQVRLTRADHGHRPMPHRPNAANGHLVRGEGRRIWIAGDTGLFSEVESVRDLAGGEIDLAVVPIGGWGPRLSGGHLTAETAAEACRLLEVKAAVPYHWGTMHLPGMSKRPAGWMDRPGRQFARELARRAPDCRAVVLEPGDGADL